MKRRALAIIAALAVLALVLVAIRLSGSDAPAARAPVASRTVDKAAAERLGKAIAIARSGPRSSVDPAAAPAERGGDEVVAVAGTVRDMMVDQPVGGVEVVFRGAAGETGAMAAADGTYRIELPPGTYRAFVRDDAVLSIGMASRVRIPGAPSPDEAGLPDEALMPQVEATRDLDGVDLGVVRSGMITGTVTGTAGKTVAGALVRAQGAGVRSALGTDLVETDSAGRFELRVPIGGYRLEVSHPRYAAAAEPQYARVEPGATVDVTLALARGCIIAGRVTAASGRPANDGAIEQKWGDGVNGFGPAGRIEPDGTFRFATLDEGAVVLRAWPWKSAPSTEQTFQCKDGVRHDGVAFHIPDRRPDVEGVLVDAAGAPVAFAHVDLVPLDVGGMAQQERTDAEGRWAVYALPPGRYQVTAQASGRGLIATELTAPQAGVRLALRGTGRLTGTIPALANGMFQLEISRCLDERLVDIARERRFVRVEGGRFSVEGLPACHLVMVAHWRGNHVITTATIPAGGSASVEIAPTPPPVRDEDEVIDNELIDGD